MSYDGPVKRPAFLGERFRLHEQAGVGGMGTVYRATDTLTGGTVAVKVLNAQADDVVERLELEGTLLAELRHPAVVRHVAHGRTSSNEPYLVMEWLDGEPLSRRLAREPLTLAETVALARRVGDGLAAAHERGVVHRDIKPGNLFLVGGEPARAKILDFGIARRWAETHHVTATGFRVGTLSYMSPEHARGERDVDARADVFSLGCVLFECLTGKKAFAGRHATAVLAKILIDEAPRVRELRSEVPRALDQLVARMLAKDRTARPPNAAAVLAELADLEGMALGSLPPIEPTAARLGVEERRFVAVLLTRDSSNDPERTVALRGGQPPSERLALDRTVGSFGGKLDVLADGSALAVFSGTGPATDLAVRAATCAREVSVAHRGAQVSIAAGLEALLMRLPVGAVIDRAADALVESPAGRVRIDEVTAGLVADRFHVEAEDRGLFLGSPKHGAEPARTLLGRATPCVGRRRELALLEASFDECISERVARVVLVVAPAGTGKSRLRYELVERLRTQGEPFSLLIGRGDSMSAGAPFALLSDALRRAAGIQSGQPPKLGRARLRARLARVLGHDEARMQRTAELISELVGIPVPEAESGPELRAARRDPTLLGDAMRSAFEELVVAEASSAPLLLVLEDLHWGDGPTVSFVDSALRNTKDAPVLVLALARPEVHQRFPSLWRERAPLEMSLPPLSPRAAQELARSVLGDQAPDEVLRSVVELAGGNAFYLEELLRSVARGDGAALPETVVGMVQARLDALGTEARRVLRAASIFGERFWLGGVLSLLGGNDEPTLADDPFGDMEHAELISRRVESRIPGDVELTFRHALVREGAYAMLTDEDRLLGHRLAGEWLLSAGEADAAILAEHFARGGAADRAIGFYQEAARQALEGNDFSAAMSLVERGLAQGAAGSARGQLLVIQAEACRWQARPAEALTAADEALGCLAKGSGGWFRALKEAIIGGSGCGEIERVRTFFELAVATPADAAGAVERLVCLCRANVLSFELGAPEISAATEHEAEALARTIPRPDPYVDGWVGWLRARAAVHGGDLGRSALATLEAMAAFERAGDVRNATTQALNAGHLLSLLGDLESSIEMLRRAVDNAERLGLPLVRGYALHHLGHVMGLTGDIAGGIALQAQAVAFAVESKIPFLESAARGYLALAELARGDLDEAERQADLALTCAPTPHATMVALGARARLHLAKGHADAALRDARAAMEQLASLGAQEENENDLRVPLAEALMATGDEQGARNAITEARAAALSVASLMPDERRRHAVLERVWANRRALELYDAWVLAPE